MRLTHARPSKSLGTADAKRSASTTLCLESPLPSPAPEILDYLTRHPDAQDTLDGILQWWVLDSCLRRWAPRIEESVTQLVALGFLEREQSGSGQIYFRLNPAQRSSLPP